MIRLFFIVCIMEIIMQIYSILRFKQSSDSKYWDKFLGITLASFFSGVLVYFAGFIDGVTLGDLILLLCIYSFSFVSNLILFSMGKKITKNLNMNRYSVSIGGLFILLNIVVLIIIPLITNG